MEKHKCGNERERTYKYMGRLFSFFPFIVPKVLANSANFHVFVRMAREIEMSSHGFR